MTNHYKNIFSEDMINFPYLISQLFKYIFVLLIW